MDDLMDEDDASCIIASTRWALQLSGLLELEDEAKD